MLHGCSYPDANNENALDTGCEAMLQGSNRLQRGLLYVQYLQATYPGTGFPTWGQFVGAHDNSAMYTSPTLQEWVTKL
jgi:hypothetical protein